MHDAESHRPKALLLSPETPYPLHGGGALRTASVLNYLARDHDVDLIVFRHRPEQDPVASLPAGLVRRTLVIDLPHHRRHVAAKMWRNGFRFVRGVPPLVDRFRGFSGEISRFIAGQRYHVSVIEHFWCAEYEPLLRSASDSVVLNLHNVESVLHETCGTADGTWLRFAHNRFGRQSRALERSWLPRFDEVLTASEPDAQRVATLAPTAKPKVFANSIPWTGIPCREEENVIAFSGNLEYHPNKSAVEFFGRAVWPALAARWPGLRWRLIGMNPESVRASLSQYPRVELTGSVEDAVTELAAAKVVVAPLLSGSGTRLKIVEAWAAGRAVVSTHLGAEGLPARDGINILLNDKADNLISCIDYVLSNREFRESLGAAGRQTYERELCWEAAWKELEFTSLSVRLRTAGLG